MIVTPTPLENVLIVVGEGLWVLSASAQLRRLVRTRNIKGLSAVTETLNTAGCVAWATYFATQHLWYPFVTNLVLIGLGLALMAYVISNKKQFAKGVASIVIIGPITSYILVRYPAAGGWVGVIYNWLAATPWLHKVVTTQKVSGMSEKGLLLALVAMLCSLTYGLLIHSWPLIVGSVQGLIYMAVVMRFYYRHRHHD